MSTNNASRAYTVEFRGANPRRYGKPWIARIVAWSVGNTPDLEWGEFIGTVKEGGIVEIEAAPGDIIRYGQKDNRGGKQTANEWTIAQSDGTLLDCTPVEAHDAYRNNN